MRKQPKFLGRTRPYRWEGLGFLADARDPPPLADLWQYNTNLGYLGSSQNREQKDYPPPDGTVGDDFFPYNEWGAWGEDLVLPVHARHKGTFTNAPGDDWVNPVLTNSVPILPGVASNVPVLSCNLKRSLLMVQNNSTATGTDVPPVLYVGFNSPAVVGFSLSLQPKGGFWQWTALAVPPDSIFVAWGTSTGVSVVTAGVVVQGLKVR